MYKDPYNQAVSAKVRANVRRHATNIDRLNGSGKLEGGMRMCPANYDPVTDPETGKTYSNRCQMSVAKSGGSSCCSRCKNCKCGGGMSGGASDTPIPAKKWFEAQNRDFEDTVAQTINPQAVSKERMDRDLGAGKGGRRCGSGVLDKLTKGADIANKLGEAFLPENSKLRKGIALADRTGKAITGGITTRSGRATEPVPPKARPSRARAQRGVCSFPAGYCRGTQKYNMRGSGAEMGLANVTPQGITPAPVARRRMEEDLGAGKFQGGARDEDEYDYEEDEEQYEDGNDCGEMEGGAADMDAEEPESLREMKSICDDYEQKKLTGGAMTKRLRDMLPRGGKKMAVSLSKLLRKLKKRGRASFARRLKLGMQTPSLEGSGRYVGGAKDYDEIAQIHDSIFGGSKLTGGYGPVAPTEEALAGYDNDKQPRGLMPPPSVNQQPGMRGGVAPINAAIGKNIKLGKGRVQTMRGCASGYGSSGGRQLIPVAQLPSKIGGGRFSKKGDYIGPSTGAIIPNLQSAAAPAGSGRASRGAMVAKLMREKGMTLGEASKALKGGAYTANDFFMPKNIHQFFGAYA